MNSNSQNPQDPTEPLREDWEYSGRTNAKGRPYEELEQYRTVVLSPDGAVVQKVFRNQLFHHCGHVVGQNTGGRCGEPGCFNVSCEKCFTRCSRCQVGLCLYHVRFITVVSDSKSPICPQCQDAVQRKQFWNRFWKTILSPFVTMNEGNR